MIKNRFVYVLTVRLFMVVTTLTLVSCGLSTPSETDVRGFIHHRYEGKIELTEYEKLNGQKTNALGAEGYILWFAGKGKCNDAVLGYRGSCKKGEMVIFTGSDGEKIPNIVFSKSERGWLYDPRISSIDIRRDSKVSGDGRSNIPTSSTDSALAAKFSGVWEYDQNGAKQYLKIIQEKPGIFRFFNGYKYKGEFVWAEASIKNANGIYLKPLNEKLTGEFVSSNFYATHGDEFTYKITLDLKSSNKLLYSVYSSIRGETDTREANKISN